MAQVHCFHQFVQVEWALQNESSVQGSIDKAIREQFSDYNSRRYSHWRKAYFEQNWPMVPASVAVKVSQLPNKYRAKARVPLKGPGAKAYDLDPQLEEELTRHERDSTHDDFVSMV